MDSLGYASAMVPTGPDVFSEFRLRTTPKWKSEITGFRPASDVLEIGPEWGDFERQGVGMPKAKRLEKLRIRRPGAGARRGNPGCWGPSALRLWLASG